MPSLNQLMVENTTMLVVKNPRMSWRGIQVINGHYPGSGRDDFTFDFDFVNNEFQILPFHFRPVQMSVTELQKRDASIRLMQTQSLLTAINNLNFTIHVEQDAIILDTYTPLHDYRRGTNSVDSPDRTRPPTVAAPAGRHFIAYFHTHPHSESIRPPTPSSDWNEVPRVGRPGSNQVLHFMIECNKRIWGLLPERRAFIVGRIDGTALSTIDQSCNGFNYCWIMS
jgi:hypothetical protein